MRARNKTCKSHRLLWIKGKKHACTPKHMPQTGKTDMHTHSKDKEEESPYSTMSTESSMYTCVTNNQQSILGW